MANVKISALPSWTGTAADLRWFVMNNSGETETFKFSGYTSPFKVFGANNSNNIYDTTAMGGTYSAILGGQSNSISSTGTHNFIGGGQNNLLGANTTQTSLTAGFNNNIQAMILGFIGGTQDNTVTSAGYTYALIGGGYNTVNATNASAGNAMYSSYFCSDTTINDGSVIGSSNNWFSGSRNCNLVGYGKHNHITNSYGSTITNSVVDDTNTQWFNKIDSSSASTITTSSKSQILGGETNLIDNSNNSTILGGFGNTINCELPALERFNTIIGGSGNTIFDSGDEQKLQTIINSVDTTLSNGVDRVTAIGLSGRTINDAISGTTYVENLKAFRQISSGFYDNGNANSGGITIDIKNGDKQQITITGSGTTSVYFIGNIAGGRLVLKVINTSTGTIGFADNSPFDWKIPTVGIPTTPNGTDVYIFESFGDQALFFASQSKDLV